MKKIISLLIIGLVSLSITGCANNDNKNKKEQVQTQSGTTDIQNNPIDTSGKAPVIIEDPSEAAGSIEITNSDNNLNGSDEPKDIE